MIELHEDTAFSMRRQAISLDQVLQMCGSSMWVKLNWHIYATQVKYCYKGGSERVKKYYKF